MTLSRRASWFLLAVGGWTWAIWPNFLRTVWRDDRSWKDGPTSFFLVHLVLVVISLATGTAVGVLGWRGLRASSGPQGDGATPTRPDRTLSDTRS